MPEFSEEQEVLIDEMASFFRMMGDPTRIRILSLLFDEELCVHTLADRLEMTQSAVSHQLALLKHAWLVRSRREGKHVYYSLADEHVKQVYELAREHLEEM
ncbi:regulatory protein ArsR [Spirochaeta thermophila DSM 6578]|uniref:Regulatory protein ArsR n=1 Tax=Winmispira thermophila (strain ATCC 700085 / DSM 6578 / Z-1203) TaxID=869211 RepID=G0GB32_WINT7|nr:metalloregulator ArsR/SmtB family transcription factor [Spirochaeta thermophila]AEJ61056.1 regulatory protein ArsR [Spirochaeta thermophila DSM 6578]